MKRMCWRVASFTFAFLVLCVLWLIFEVPYAIRDWFVDRWRFAVELWAITGQENTDA